MDRLAAVTHPAVFTIPPHRAFADALAAGLMARYGGGETGLASGMVLQCDIIPTPLPYGTALNCEDTVALADGALRDELSRDFPELWARIVSRRAFMAESLGLTLAPEVLPLSFANAYLPPFWLDDALVCTLA